MDQTELKPVRFG